MMKRIEIKTPDRVPITFDVAALRDRAFAFLIDFIILFGFIFILLMLQSMIFQLVGPYFVYLVIAPVFLFYTLAFELLLGGITPGKKAMNLRVIKLNGKYARPVDYIIRWVFRWLDIWMSFFVIGSLLISSNRYGQRLGDMMAGTSVIRTGKNTDITLEEILRIETGRQYTPRYPQVTMLTDKDMLLVKTVLSRLRTVPNRAHRKAAALLVEKLKQELNIDEEIRYREAFLRTLLKDYVVLTR